MKGLLGLIGQIAALNVTRTVARAKRSGIMIGISVLLFLTAYMFGLIALALRLARHHPPEVAALFVAGALLLGLIVLVALMIWNRIEDRRARRRRLDMQANIAFGLSLLQSQPMLMAALAAGFAASLFGKKKDDDA